MKKLYRILILPYILLLLYFMFLGFGRTQMDDHIVRMEPLLSTQNFIQQKLLWSDWENITINLLGNIVMFIPFGFLGIAFPKYNQFKPLIIAFLSVLIAVEALQYFTRLGVFDVDDLLLNSLGVWIGFYFYKK